MFYRSVVTGLEWWVMEVVPQMKEKGGAALLFCQMGCLRKTRRTIPEVLRKPASPRCCVSPRRVAIDSCLPTVHADDILL